MKEDYEDLKADLELKDQKLEDIDLKNRELKRQLDTLEQAKGFTYEAMQG